MSFFYIKYKVIISRKMRKNIQIRVKKCFLYSHRCFVYVLRLFDFNLFSTIVQLKITVNMINNLNKVIFDRNQIFINLNFKLSVFSILNRHLIVLPLFFWISIFYSPRCNVIRFNIYIPYSLILKMKFKNWQQLIVFLNLSQIHP